MNKRAARSIIIKSKRARPGERMASGKGWTLVSKGKKAFGGTLIHTINWGSARFAIFNVPK